MFSTAFRVCMEKNKQVIGQITGNKCINYLIILHLEINCLSVFPDLYVHYGMCGGELYKLYMAQKGMY